MICGGKPSMSDERRTKNQVSYIFSKEVILKDLLQQGVISDLEFARYDEMLYDRYQLDAETGIPRPASPSISEQPEQPCTGKETYMSLTAEAKKVFENAPGYAVQSWLRDGNTIALLHYWEVKNNPDFNTAGYEALLEELKSPSLTLTAKKWIEATNAIGLQSKQGKNGGTYAHPEIACAFCAWLHPEFHYSLIQSFLATHQRWGTQHE